VTIIDANDRMTALTALSNVVPTTGDGGGPHAKAGGSFLDLEKWRLISKSID